MPKMKTRKCISKRVKRTGTGKYKYYKAGRRHLIQVAPMVLAHRMRRMPFDTTDGLPEDWESVLNG